ncbi:flippase [Butyrivibrio proteoclasticus]|uniref:flippase n=1 Tax=Butyrivibrio proteoclasticus TaxID=43305 RepID=UPI00047AF7D4|nr:flippase [Butyrivibrio proteoclasticus]
MKTKKSVKSNYIFNAIYQLSCIIVPIVTLPYLSRTLHAEGLGEYSFAYSVAYYFYIFIRLGLHNYGNRTIAYVKNDEVALARTFSDIFSFQLFLGVVGSGGYLLYCFFISSNRITSLIFSLVVMTGGIDLTWALYGLEEFTITSIRDVIVKIATAVLIFIFVKEAYDVWKYALIFSIGFMVSQVISLLVVVKRIHFTRPELSGVISHIKPNLILFLPTIAVSIYKTMDKIMLGSISGDTELGYYHSCENIIMVPLALITALGTVMLPRVSNMISNNVEDSETKNTFNKSIMFAMFVSTSICFGIMTVAKEFVPLFFGDGFDRCIDIFIVILPSCVFLAFANVIRTQYLLPRKKDVFFVASLFAGAFVNLVLNVLLIPRYASVGAAVGTLVAEVTVCIIQAAYVYKEADIEKNVLDSLPFIMAGILMFVSGYSITLHLHNELLALLLKIIISGIIYMVVLIGIKLFTKIIKF